MYGHGRVCMYPLEAKEKLFIIHLYKHDKCTVVV